MIQISNLAHQASKQTKHSPTMEAKDKNQPIQAQTMKNLATAGAF